MVTNLEDAPETIYDERYTARGDMEDRIKEQQLGLFAGCHAHACVGMLFRRPAWPRKCGPYYAPHKTGSRAARVPHPRAVAAGVPAGRPTR